MSSRAIVEGLIRLLVLLAVDGCAGAPAPILAAPSPPDPCDMAADWDVDAMARGGREAEFGSRPAELEVRVLAWQQIVDERPFRVDAALLWMRIGDGSFRLAHVYRHPDDAGDPAWHLATIDDLPGNVGAVPFPAPPTHADLDGFLARSLSPFSPEQDGYRRVASRVCVRAWRATFGEPPWRARPLG